MTVGNVIATDEAPRPPSYPYKALRLQQLPNPYRRREIRRGAGLTAADIAAHLRVTRQAVSNWERGVRTPSGDLLERYIVVLHSLDHLTRGDA
jgi:DNA-binding transcriptional regulator YiaG